MAARTVKIRHDDNTRAKIKTSQLINRLQRHVLSKTKLENSQIKSIEILLRKTLPDLSTVTLEGGDTPIRLETFTRTIVDPKAG
jgi:hypothetical protein